MSGTDAPQLATCLSHWVSEAILFLAENFASVRILCQNPDTPAPQPRGRILAPGLLYQQLYHLETLQKKVDQREEAHVRLAFWECGESGVIHKQIEILQT